MVIDGVSQSTGADRVVEVAAHDADVLLVIRDRAGNAERDRVVVPADLLLAVLTDRPDGPQVVDGAGGRLVVEVRRNEVLLAAGTADAAVGLDDFTDALAGALPPA